MDGNRRRSHRRRYRRRRCSCSRPFLRMAMWRRGKATRILLLLPPSPPDHVLEQSLLFLGSSSLPSFSPREVGSYSCEFQCDAWWRKWCSWSWRHSLVRGSTTRHRECVHDVQIPACCWISWRSWNRRRFSLPLAVKRSWGRFVSFFADFSWPWNNLFAVTWISRRITNILFTNLENVAKTYALLLLTHYLCSLKNWSQRYWLCR